ncbi:MAG: HAMP domain-containing protein [Caldilineales bacterium]|nr:HAMP domain-containing protein [Caldilineales bacterium]
MNRLWVRLSLAFALVTILATVLAFVLANRQVDIDFRHYLTRSQTDQALVEALAVHWSEYGSWGDANTLFQSTQSGRGRGQGGPKRILADAEGIVVFDESGGAAGDQLTAAQINTAAPIQVGDEIVGYLYVVTPGQAALAEAETTFLAQVNRALLQAALIASLLGILLGVVIARSLSAPLGRLAEAVTRLAAGNLAERAPLAGADEIVEAAQAFNDMADSLQQAETLRQNLVADIAHELRTPLTVIQGNLQAILDDVYPLEKSEIALIYDETVLLNRLIQDLRQLAQAEAGQLDLHQERIDAAALATGIVANFAEAALAKSIRLTSDLPPGLPAVWADPDRLRQVFANLIGNALRYTPDGGDVRVSASAQGDFARFCVRDSGPGIPAEHLPHVFDRFWRAEPSRAREQGGSGLGLAIVRQLVEAQGGRVGVESEAGRGSEFWFMLPVAQITNGLGA